MRRDRRVAVLSDASFAPFDKLRQPPQGVCVHRLNDGGDIGGPGQGPLMDRLVAELVKQNKKAKIYAVFCFAGKKNYYFIFML
jgi:hypothetical protein